MNMNMNMYDRDDLKIMTKLTGCKREETEAKIRKRLGTVCTTLVCYVACHSDVLDANRSSHSCL